MFHHPYTQANIVYTIYNTPVASAARKGNGSMYISGHDIVCCTSSLTIPSHQTRKTKYKPTGPSSMYKHPPLTYPPYNERDDISFFCYHHLYQSVSIHMMAGQPNRLLVGRYEGRPGGKLSRRNSPSPKGIVLLVHRIMHKT